MKEKRRLTLYVFLYVGYFVFAVVDLLLYPILRSVTDQAYEIVPALVYGAFRFSLFTLLILLRTLLNAFLSRSTF